MIKIPLRILKTLAIAILLIALALFVYPWVLRGLGYYVDNTGGEVAEIAAQKKDVSLCKKITVYARFMGPTAGSRTRECIYTYAELTKDPSVCELLMPSSYGLSCVGAATSSFDICVMKSDGVAWNDGKVSYESCRHDDPKRGTEGNQCCLVARVAFVKSENDCSSLSAYPEIHDECLQSLSFKNGDPTSCDGIVNGNTKAACIVNAKAIRENPAICSGCKARVATVNELK